MTCPGASARGAEGCRHQALLYSSDEELLSVLAAFVGDGLEQNEPALVVAPAGSVALLADALGARRREVVFVDAADWLKSPSYALTSYRRF